MHHHGKFGEYPSNRCLDIAILLLSRWRPSAMLDFFNWEFLQSTGYTQSACVITPNLVKVGRTVAEIRCSVDTTRDHGP